MQKNNFTTILSQGVTTMLYYDTFNEVKYPVELPYLSINVPCSNVIIFSIPTTAPLSVGHHVEPSGFIQLAALAALYSALATPSVTMNSELPLLITILTS